MTANAVAEEYPAVATRASRHILADAVRWQGYVRDLLQVIAHVVEQGKPKHGAVGARAEERPRCGPGGDHTGRGSRGQFGVQAGLCGLLQRVVITEGVTGALKVLIVVVVRR